MHDPETRPFETRRSPAAGNDGAARPPAPRRIGLLGGSFDPVHCGHLHVARAALAAFGLERVVFVPAARAPHKSGPPAASDEDRLSMLRLAIADEPRFSISDLELRRGGVSFTIDTVRALPKELGLSDDVEIYLLIGSDNLLGLPRWQHANELLARVHPIVVHRDGDPDRLLESVRGEVGDELFARLRAGYLRVPPVRVSSTELRSSPRVAMRSDEEIPAMVRAYIREHRLYGAGA
jgi:nicotinate-nucleotide adenylyltransferase